jgi:hypothetical protein
MLRRCQRILNGSTDGARLRFDTFAEISRAAMKSPRYKTEPGKPGLQAPFMGRCS